MQMRRCHVIELARKAQRIENERKRAEKKIKNGCTLESRKEKPPNVQLLSERIKG
jgi:hypothetical protein